MSELQQPNHPDLWQFFRRWRFSLLLVILVGFLAGLPLVVGFGLSGHWFDALMSLLMVASILPLCFEPYQRLLALTLGIPTILFALFGQVLPGTLGAGVLVVAHCCEALFFLGAAGLIVRSLFHARALPGDSIFGAACGYLFLGLGFAVLYAVIEQGRPGSFDVSPTLAVPGEPPHLLPQVLTYYSFVTLTTVGYGDITPVSPTARTFAWMEAMSGQFYIAVVVAGLVSMIVTKTDTASPPDRHFGQG